MEEGKPGSSRDQVCVEGPDPLAHRQASVGDARRRRTASSGRARAAATSPRLPRSAAPRAEVAGTTALKAEPEAKLSPTEQLEPRIEHAGCAQRTPRRRPSEKRAEATAKGYEGEACGECGNFTLVRNGTCMKCDTCGSTTGCS